jgi:flagellar motor switch protein FliM
MGLVMKHLPKRIYDDVLKEEMETVKAIGENASKIISTSVAQIARKIVIG